MSKYKYKIIPRYEYFIIARRKRFTRAWEVVTKVGIDRDERWTHEKAKELGHQTIKALKEIKEIDAIVLEQS